MTGEGPPTGMPREMQTREKRQTGMRRRAAAAGARIATVLAAVATGMTLVSCGGGGSERGAAQRDRPEKGTQQGKPSGRKPPAAPTRKRLPKMNCDPALTNCVVASGTVIYVERVDPDGDGDAHFVTVSKDNVTGGGLTVFDVREDLRPDPLPGPGALVGGVGPVYTGSYGQKQIEVTEFHVAR